MAPLRRGGERATLSAGRRRRLQAIIGGKTAEPTEPFRLTVTGIAGATIARGTGTVTIIDNDSALVVERAADQPLGVTLEAADLPAALEAARQTWLDAGVEASFLDAVEVEIAALPGLVLGQTDGTLVRLDLDAAGWGWSLDGTSAGVDLVAVLRHELGHVLGLSHEDEDEHALMAEVLAAPLASAGTATSAGSTRWTLHRAHLKAAVTYGGPPRAQKFVDTAAAPGVEGCPRGHRGAEGVGGHAGRPGREVGHAESAAHALVAFLRRLAGALISSQALLVGMIERQ